MVESSNSPSAIRRTRVACKACNSRRVKCDAADGMPCMHCRTRQTSCELIESKRGRYARQQSNKSRRSLGRASSGQIPNPPNLPDTPPDTIHVSAHEDDAQIQETPTPMVQSLPAQGAQARQPAQSGTSLTLSTIVQIVHHVKEGDLAPIQATDYGSVFPTEKVSLQSSTELGQSLSLQDALVMPDPQVSDQLIRSFFQNFHPAYPIIDRLSFINLYKQGRASPLLLHTIYLVALTCGPEHLVQLAGFTDRTTARKTHYLRAKALYDTDHETDATSLAGALHLLSFWWFGPSDQKDSWYWQGCAVTLAQSLGMHRSLAQRGMSQRLTSIWKRIWWSIYDRDRHVAAALGRPCRIRDEDCDIEPLDENDLLVDLVDDEELVPAQEPHHISYFLEITKLSAILGDIVIGEFSPRRPALEIYDTAYNLGRLQSWHSQIPHVMSHNPSHELCAASFWARMLDVSYQSARILLFRPKVAECEMFSESEREMWARMAADAITRTAEDLLATETIHYAQLHIVPALFSALSIHTLAMGQKNTIQRQLAENKSRQCILALGELYKVWPVGMWVVKSFANLLRRLIRREYTSNQRSQPSTETGGETDGCNGAEVGAGARGDSTVQQPSSLPELQSASIPHYDVVNGTSGCFPNGQSDRGQNAPLFQSHTYPDLFRGLTDQVVYDSAWFGCLENMLDVELLQKELGICPLNLTPLSES